MIVELCAGLPLTVGRASVNILLLVNTPCNSRSMNDFCFRLNQTAFFIAQTDFFDRKNTFNDYDFTTEAVVLGNQSVCDSRLIGRAVIIITERTGSA